MMRVGANRPLTLDLWQTVIHEAHILAGMADGPVPVSPKQVDAWV